MTSPMKPPTPGQLASAAATSSPQPSTLEKVGEAIADAQATRGFMLFDYTGYQGIEPPHVVKDERSGREVHRGGDPREARLIYERLERDRIARAALQSLRQVDDETVEAMATEHGWRGLNRTRDTANLAGRGFKSIVRSILTEGGEG